MENAIRLRIEFPEEQVKAIGRIQEEGNFVAHLTSHRIKQRLKRVKDFDKWEATSRDVTDLEKMKAVNRIIQSERIWITRSDALKDLLDSLAILLTLSKAM